MAVTGVSSSSPTYQSNPFVDFRQAFMQMAKAINSGDLAGAQQAFASLSEMQGGNQPAANSPVAQALNQIGQDLQNGDIGGAQQALNALKSQMQHTHHHGRHHPSASSTEGSATSTDSDGTQAPGTTGSAINVLA